MDKVELYFKHRIFDMVFTVINYSIDEDGDVDIIDYNLEFDYVISEEYPHPADGIIKMFSDMLKDGEHLKEIIMQSLADDEIEKILEQLREEWHSYHEEQLMARGDYEYDLQRDEGM